MPPSAATLGKGPRPVGKPVAHCFPAGQDVPTGLVGKKQEMALP